MNEDFKYLLELDYSELVERQMVIEHYHLDLDDPAMRDYFLEELGVVESLIKKWRKMLVLHLMKTLQKSYSRLTLECLKRIISPYNSLFIFIRKIENYRCNYENQNRWYQFHKEHRC